MLVDVILDITKDIYLLVHAILNITKGCFWSYCELFIGACYFRYYEKLFNQNFYNLHHLCSE